MLISTLYKVCYAHFSFNGVRLLKLQDHFNSVLDVASPQAMQGGKTTQNVVIADDTGYTKLTLWEEHVGYLHPNKSYHLKNMLLRVYNGERYLATAKHDSSITNIYKILMCN